MLYLIVFYLLWYFILVTQYAHVTQPHRGLNHLLYQDIFCNLIFFIGHVIQAHSIAFLDVGAYMNHPERE